MTRFSIMISFLTFFFALSLAGCAETKFRSSVTAETNGIRYYLPATYVLIKPDYSKGAADVSYWVGPDTTILHAADPSAIASTNATELEFDKGCLSSASSHVDTTKVATDAIGALDDLAKSILTTAAKSAQLAATGAARGKVEPQIYLFVIGHDNAFHTLFSPEHGAVIEPSQDAVVVPKDSK